MCSLVCVCVCVCVCLLHTMGRKVCRGTQGTQVTWKHAFPRRSSYLGPDPALIKNKPTGLFLPFRQRSLLFLPSGSQERLKEKHEKAVSTAAYSCWCWVILRHQRHWAQLLLSACTEWKLYKRATVVHLYKLKNKFKSPVQQHFYINRPPHWAENRGMRRPCSDSNRYCIGFHNTLEFPVPTEYMSKYILCYTT